MNPEDEFDFSAQRRRMLDEHLAGRDIRSPAVLRAMAEVPRHAFVLPSDWDQAYADHPLAIGCGQTVSQPYIVAYMTQALALEPGMRVLEVGTGSGYQTAVLAAMGVEVFTVERHVALGERAAGVLRRLGYAQRVRFRVGDGSLGWPEHAPFARVLVTAAAPAVPLALTQQLAEGARMVIPVGRDRQRLKIVTRGADACRVTDDLGVVFVKLVGEQGFAG